MRASVSSVFVATLLASALPALAGEWSGNLAVEARLFQHDASDPAQHGANASLALEPEFYHDFDDGRQRIVFAPFLRLDQGDKERSHGDLREFYWRRSFDNWEASVGVRKVYWGVTEAAHLVDIINQTDFIENLDTEDKLGQPMINVRFLPDWGTLELFVMPWFRERTFAGDRGRIRAPLPILAAEPIYESSDEEQHIDLAARWSHTLGDWDIGLAHFSGTARAPLFVPTLTGSGQLGLRPFYAQLEQTSLDLQATLGDWLWKLEVITADRLDQRYSAFAAGFEYTLIGVFGSDFDLGLIAEYLFDDRPTTETSVGNDVAIGGRLVLNDEQSTELLAFSGIDADTQSRFTSVEGSRRFGQSWKLSLEARFFSNTRPGELLYGLRNEDYIELELAKYF